MLDGYRIGELAEKTGVTKRTVHYYVAKGLIPPPEGMGVNSTYDDTHLKRILLIKKLQERYLPLDRIREEMSSLDDAEVEAKLGAMDDGRDISFSQDRCIEDSTAYYSNNNAPFRGKSNEEGARAYVRFDLGPGLELHCLDEVREEYSGIILKIKKYAKKLLEER